METMIECVGLKKNFRTPFTKRKVEAVKGISFKVEKGETFGFLGPNGAGKTTTIKILCGLVKPSAGFVRVISGSPQSISVRARIGYLPEQPYFYDYLTPIELLDVFGRLFGIPSHIRKQRIHELLEKVGVAHATSRSLRKFSKGMQQRVGIAQALLNDPDLLILDEPLSGLDPIGRIEVRDLLIDLKSKGKTIFFSSHILSDIEKLCDKVAIIVKGEIIQYGRLDDLLRGSVRETEILVRGKDGEDIGQITDVRLVENLGGGVRKLICPLEMTDKVLCNLLDQGYSILSVAEYRMSLEDLLRK